MRLTLNYSDLKPEHENISCSKTKIEHFKPEVQAIVKMVGKAKYETSVSYNVIYPDKKGQQANVIDKVKDWPSH